MKNFEKYKTPEERTKAFDCFCKQRVEKECSPCGECELLNPSFDCKFAWLDLDA